jgi:hypothetical protein
VIYFWFEGSKAQLALAFDSIAISWLAMQRFFAGSEDFFSRLTRGSTQVTTLAEIAEKLGLDNGQVVDGAESILKRFVGEQRTSEDAFQSRSRQARPCTSELCGLGTVLLMQ